MVSDRRVALLDQREIGIDSAYAQVHLRRLVGASTRHRGTHKMRRRPRLIEHRGVAFWINLSPVQRPEFKVRREDRDRSHS